MERDLSARHYETVERTIVFIRNNLRRQPTLEEIAQAVHMSPFHLQRVFSEWAGLSPKRFLQYLTKEHAKASLLRSRTVLEVADDLGMSSSRPSGIAVQSTLILFITGCYAVSYQTKEISIAHLAALKNYF